MYRIRFHGRGGQGAVLAGGILATALVDTGGTVLSERQVRHDGQALQDLATALIAHAGGQAAAVAVAIEVPHGAVVETLLARGVVVFALNPKQLDRFRDRFTVAGAKDDRRDARVLADAVRTALINKRAGARASSPGARPSSGP